MPSNHPLGKYRGRHARQREPSSNPDVSTIVREAWGSQNSLDSPGARTPEEVFFDLQEPTQQDNPREGTQNSLFHMPQSLHCDNIDPSLVDWQSFQLASQVPQAYNSQNNEVQSSFYGSYPPSLQQTDGSYFSDGNYLPSAHSHNPIYSQQIASYNQNSGGYPNTSNPYFQHQIQTFHQSFPAQSILSEGSRLSAMAPPVMAPVQELQSFVQPQQHSQPHYGFSGQWRANTRGVFPSPQRSQNRGNSQQLALLPTSEPETRNPSVEGYAYVPVNPRFGDLYRPKQRDNMGNPTTWEHIVTKEEYTDDELRVIHDGIEVWAYLHTHPEIRRLGADH